MLEEDEIANYTGGMRIFIGDPAIEATGTLMITSRRVVWLPSNGQQRVQGFSLFYQAIAMHAVSRDVSDFPHPCLYVQLDAEQNISEVSDALRQGGGPAVKRQRQAGEAGEAPAEGEEAEDEVEPVDYQEMRLVPAAPSDAALDAMFKAMSEGVCVARAQLVQGRHARSSVTRARGDAGGHGAGRHTHMPCPARCTQRATHAPGRSKGDRFWARVIFEEGSDCTMQVLRSTPTRTTARGATTTASSPTRTSCSPGSRPSSSRCSRG